MTTTKTGAQLRDWAPFVSILYMNKENLEFNKRSVEAFNFIKENVMGDALLMDNLIDIGTLGSINDNEGVKGWSDLDILMVLKSDELGNIDLDVIQRLREIHNECVTIYSDLDVSLLPHTMYDFEKYVAYEYLRNYQFATIYYSKETVSFRDRLQKIIDDRGVSLEVQKRYAVYRARHLRFNLIRAVASWRGNNKPVAKLVIDRLIQSGIYITGFYGEYSQGKVDRLNMIKRLIDDQEIINIFERATNLRFKWSEINESECKEIIKNGLSDLYKVENFLISKYPEAIPEEYMNI